MLEVYLPTIYAVLLASILGLFFLTLLLLTSSLFDSPTAQLNQFELVSSCFTLACIFWLAGNGVAVSVELGDKLGGGLELDYIPLGLTLFLIAILYFCAKRLNNSPLRVSIIGAAIYTALCLVIFSFGDETGSSWLLLRLVIPFGFSLLTLVMANVEGSFFTYLYSLRQRLGQKVPRFLTHALRGSITLIASLLVLTTLLTMYALVTNLSSTQKIFDTLNAGPWSVILISIYMLFLLPNFIFYNLSMLISSGFQIGNLAHFSLYQSDVAIIPDDNVAPPLPILGSVITQSSLLIPQIVFSVVISIVAVFITFYQAKKLQYEYLFSAFTKGRLIISEICYMLLVVVLTCLCVTVGALLLNFLASGTISDQFGFIGANYSVLPFDLLIYYSFGSFLVFFGYCVYKFVKLLQGVDKFDIMNIVKSVRDQSEKEIEREHKR